MLIYLPALGIESTQEHLLLAEKANKLHPACGILRVVGLSMNPIDR